MSEKEYLYYEDDDRIPPYKEIDPGVPLWLKFVILFVPLWGFAAFYLYWNGNFNDWFDRGYWGQLQHAANTTFPAETDVPASAKEIEAPQN